MLRAETEGQLTLNHVRQGIRLEGLPHDSTGMVCSGDPPDLVPFKTLGKQVFLPYSEHPMAVKLTWPTLVKGVGRPDRLARDSPARRTQIEEVLERIRLQPARSGADIPVKPLAVRRHTHLRKERGSIPQFWLLRCIVRRSATSTLKE